MSGQAAERHRGREAALQLLYQWEVGQLDADQLAEAADFFWTTHPAPDGRRVFATSLVMGTTADVGTIDPLITECAANWRLSRMAVIDRLILRLAVYELVHADTPAPVVINEALELAKTFSGAQAVAFVNGVLDAVRRRLEEDEDEGQEEPSARST